MHEQPIIIDGKSLAAWDTEWTPYNIHADEPSVAYLAGLYRVRHRGEIAFIGMSTDANGGGLRKRLRDFTRVSPSARGYSSGWWINANLPELTFDVIVVGIDAHAAVVTRELNKAMNLLHRPFRSRTDHTKQ